MSDTLAVGPQSDYRDGEMKPQDHNKIIALGFAFFAALFAITFALLMVVSLGVFVALGITMASETGDNTNVGIGIAGGIFSIIFYCVLGVFFVLIPGLTSWNAFKVRPRTKVWGTIASITAVGLFPLGTMLGVYALWFFYGSVGKEFYGLNRNS